MAAHFPRTAPVLALLLVVAVASAACQSGAAVAPMTPANHSAHVELVSSLETAYYDTSGTTSVEILDSARTNGPVDDQGKAAVGLTTQKASLATKTESDGELCWLADATITLDVLVTLPRHAGLATLAPGVRDGFERWSAAIATHEQRHVDIYRAGAERTKTALGAVSPAPDCATVANEVQAAWDTTMQQTEADQEAFHAEDRTREDAARAPLASQVEANRARLDDLSAQVASLDTRLATLRHDLDNARSTSQYNALVDQHNAVVVQRNALVDELNALADETDSLIEELNWTT